jgi:hypothetical protein
MANVEKIVTLRLSSAGVQAIEAAADRNDAFSNSS